MAQFSQILKSEIVRLARKEIRSEVQSLRKAAAQYRSDIAALKRQLVEQQRRISRLEKFRPQAVAEPSDETTSLRFRAAGFATLRQKLGLSAADMGRLIGVSAQTVYNWERGESKPKAQQLAHIAEARKLGKRAAQERLQARD
jgi:DNA-binding transcriptional regulator YiaG